MTISPIASDEISLSPWLSSSRTIFETVCSMRSGSTGRLRSAICTERINLSRSNGTRRLLRLMTVNSRSCTRSNVVKRKLQVRQTRRRRITAESSVGRESLTCVSRLPQLGQRMARPLTSHLVMPGFMPGIHVLVRLRKEGVDGRDIGSRKHAVLRTAMPGHDGENVIVSLIGYKSEIAQSMFSLCRVPRLRQANLPRPVSATTRRAPRRSFRRPDEIRRYRSHALYRQASRAGYRTSRSAFRGRMGYHSCCR